MCLSSASSIRVSRTLYTCALLCPQCLKPCST
jgi:hypothetical protein